MALEQKLSVRLSQRLVMTPSLQQAIKLLQMSKLELVEEVQQELLENPVLEETASPEPATVSAAEAPAQPVEEPLATSTMPPISRTSRARTCRERRGRPRTSCRASRTRWPRPCTWPTT